MFNSKKKKILIFIIAYTSLIVGFYFNENSSGGALPDFNHHFEVVLAFQKNFLDSIYNYHIFQNDHSPLFITFLLFFFEILENETVLRFCYLHLAIIIQLLFYECLKENFNQITQIKLFILSCIIYLSPFVRSLSIWPGSEIISLIFFILSILFYLKFVNKNKKIFFAFLNIFFLAIASYYRPIYSVFSIFFIYEFYKAFKFGNKFFFTVLFNLVLSLPAFIFVFYVNDFLIKFFLGGNTIYNFSLSNNLLIVSSILFFYLLFFLKYFLKYKNILSLKNINFKEVMFIVLVSIPLILTFNFDVNQIGNGGGFFLKLSNLIFGNNYLFYFLVMIAFYCFYQIIKMDTIKHSLLFCCIFLQNPHGYFYHEYYEPLFVILFFTVFNKKLNQKFFDSNMNIYTIYMFYAFFYLINLVKNSNYFINSIIY